MARTIRNQVTKSLYYCFDAKYEYQGEEYLTYRTRDLTQGGWKEAKRILSKEEYAKLRRLTGDSLTKHTWFSSIPREFRNCFERSNRAKAKQDLHKFKTREYHEVMCNQELRDCGRYYW